MQRLTVSETLSPSLVSLGLYRLCRIGPKMPARVGKLELLLSFSFSYPSLLGRIVSREPCPRPPASSLKVILEKIFAKCDAREWKLLLQDRE